MFYHGTQKYGTEYFSNPKEMSKRFNLNNKLQVIVDDDIENRIESHTVFEI